LAAVFGAQTEAWLVGGVPPLEGVFPGGAPTGRHEGIPGGTAHTPKGSVLRRHNLFLTENLLIIKLSLGTISAHKHKMCKFYIRVFQGLIV